MATKISLLPTTQVVGWGSGTYDVNISRVSAGIIQIGTTAANALGQLNLGVLSVGGATPAGNALAVTGTSALGASLTLNGATLSSGDSLAVAGQLTVGSANIIRFLNRVSLLSPADNAIQFSNFALSTASILSFPANGAFQLGAADAASPVAQTLRVQSVVAGTTNTAGVDWTDISSVGTGTGAGGKRIFRTAPAGASGSSQNALADALTLTAPAINMQPSVVVGNQALATTATDGFLYITSGAGAPTGVPTAFSGRMPLYYDSSANQLYIYNSGWKQPKTPAGAATVTWQ